MIRLNRKIICGSDIKSIQICWCYNNWRCYFNQKRCALIPGLFKSSKHVERKRESDGNNSSCWVLGSFRGLSERRTRPQQPCFLLITFVFTEMFSLLHCFGLNLLPGFYSDTHNKSISLNVGEGLYYFYWWFIYFRFIFFFFPNRPWFPKFCAVGC